jgi:hypothetical protein
VFHQHALYQGTTSVVPKSAEKTGVLTPEAFDAGYRAAKANKLPIHGFEAQDSGRVTANRK